MFSDGEASQAGQKTNKVLAYIFLLTYPKVLHLKKICIIILSIKMFIGRKTRAEKVYAYIMLISF